MHASSFAHPLSHPTSKMTIWPMMKTVFHNGVTAFIFNFTLHIDHQPDHQ
jgi:hypothetical protein